MKKIVMAALVAVASLSANAQVWLGGSLGFQSTKLDGADESTTAFEIAPVIGYTLSDNWDIALEISEKYVNMPGDIDANAFSIAPFARYTFAKAGIASFFVDGGFQVGSTDLGVNNTKLNSSRTSFGIGLRPGVKVALSDKVAIDAKLGWLGYQTVEDSYDSFGLYVNNSALSFGMTWSF